MVIWQIVCIEQGIMKKSHLYLSIIFHIFFGNFLGYWGSGWDKDSLYADERLVISSITIHQILAHPTCINSNLKLHLFEIVNAD